MAFERLRRRVGKWRAGSPPTMDPVPAYDLWSASYDDGDNLIVSLDVDVFGDLLRDVPVEARAVLDVGCGTGRHWDAIRARAPSSLRGVDASAGMLAQLRRRYPDADVELADGRALPSCPDRSVDVLTSTLALGHMPDLSGVMTEWFRVLRPGGDLVLTDLHPVAVVRGGCTFEHEGKTIAVTLYEHPIESIVDMGRQHQVHVVRRLERNIDDSVRAYFEQRGQLEMFRSLLGVPLIYGLHLRKTADPPR